MTADQLRSLQAPIKERYRRDPAEALATLHASGTLDLPKLQCIVAATPPTPAVAGVHPRAGGDGAAACAGDMLLQSLVACAGVTLCAVATAMNLDVSGGNVTAEGDLDFRGTLGVSREAPVGFTAIRLSARLQTTADAATLHKLGELTERYCVVAQSLKPKIEIQVVPA